MIKMLTYAIEETWRFDKHIYFKQTVNLTISYIINEYQQQQILDALTTNLPMDLTTNT